MNKRVYDLAGVTDRRVKTVLNGVTLDVKTFTDYADLYLKKDRDTADELPRIVATPNDRWKVVASLSEGTF